MSLTLPLAFWNGPPRLTFTSLTFADDGTRLVTGSYTGPIVVWTINHSASPQTSTSSARDGAGDATPSPSPSPSNNADSSATRTQGGQQGHVHGKSALSPTVVLLGHDACVTALACAVFDVTSVVVSASIDGTLAVWDVSDGRCLNSVRKLLKSPTNMATFISGRYVAVGGRTTDISIIDVKRLTVVSTLTGHQDWVKSLHVVDMLPIPSLVSLAQDGEVRYWTLGTSMERFEASVRSKHIEVLQPLQIAVSPNLVFVLVVSTERWVLLTANELEPVFSVPSPVGSEWSGGSFVSSNSITLWTKDGHACMYDIPRVTHITPLTLDVGASLSITPESTAEKASKQPSGANLSTASDPFDVNENPVNEWLIVEADFGLVQYNKSRASQSSNTVSHGDTGKLDANAGAVVPELVCYFVELSGATNLVHRPSTPATSTQGTPVVSPMPSPIQPFKQGTPAMPGSSGGPQASEDTVVAAAPASGSDSSVANVPPCYGDLQDLPLRFRGHPHILHSRRYGPLMDHHPPLTTWSHGLLATCDWDGMVTLWCTRDVPRKGQTVQGGQPSSASSSAHDNIPYGVIRPVAWAELADGWAAGSCSKDDNDGDGDARAKQSRVTATVAIADEALPLELVLGTSDGRIRIATLPHGEAERSVAAHSGAVRSLLVTNHGNLLVSGGDDGLVVVWNPFTVEKLKVFRQHVMPVTSLFQPSADTPQKMFCSVGSDGMIAVYSVAPLQCMRVLGGHSSPVKNIYWRLNGGYLLAACADGSVTAWDVNSGRNESHANLEAAIMMADRCAASGPMASFRRRAKLPEGVCSHVRRPATPHSIEAMSVAMGQDDPPMQVLILNTKVIIASLARQRAQRPRTRSTVAPNSGLADDSPSVPGSLVAADGSKTNTSPRSSPGAARMSYHGETTRSTLPPLYAVFTYLVPWGYDQQLDELCRTELGLEPPNPPVAFGVRGHAQAFSVFVPAAVSGLRRWQCSPQMTAIHSVAAVALSKSLMYLADHQNLCSQLSAHYIAIMPERLPSYCEPSIPLLARYWQDPVADIQEATRMVFEGALLRLSDTERRALVDFWSGKLKGSVAEAADLSGITGIAVLVIAIVGCDHPEYVDPGVAAAVTQALSRVLRSCSSQRSIAAELLGTGFPLWRYYIKDIPQLLRELFSLAYDADSNPGLLKAARHALVTVGAGEPGMFINAMGELALRTGLAPREHQAALNAISQLIKKSPVSLLPYIPQLLEAITRVLDPNNIELRSSILPSCTSVLHEIVKRFPMVSFHQERQLLAVGTRDAVIIIYDLRTATKRRVLEGLKSPVSALCFSYDGIHLVSYSAKEGLVKLWKTDFNRVLSKIGWGGKSLRSGNVQPIPSGIKGNALLTSVRIEWISPTTVLIKNSREEKMLTML